MKDVLPTIEEWRAQGDQVATATVVKVYGSAPRPLGAKLAVSSSGKMVGSVSGGCVEGAVYDAAQESIKTGKRQLLHFGITDEMAFDVGLACGGTIEVFVEPIDW
jgi:xanthine/CO dehydrogenase XdhC/CoxF family maturation factor